MLNYDEEIKKFKPLAELDQLEDRLYAEDFQDMAEILIQVMQRTEQNAKGQEIDE